MHKKLENMYKRAIAGQYSAEDELNVQRIGVERIVLLSTIIDMELEGELRVRLLGRLDEALTQIGKWKPDSVRLKDSPSVIEGIQTFLSICNVLSQKIESGEFERERAVNTSASAELVEQKFQNIIGRIEAIESQLVFLASRIAKSEVKPSSAARVKPRKKTREETPVKEMTGSSDAVDDTIEKPAMPVKSPVATETKKKKKKKKKSVPAETVATEGEEEFTEQLHPELRKLIADNTPSQSEVIEQADAVISASAKEQTEERATPAETMKKEEPTPEPEDPVSEKPSLEELIAASAVQDPTTYKISRDPIQNSKNSLRLTLRELDKKRVSLKEHVLRLKQLGAGEDAADEELLKSTAKKSDELREVEGEMRTLFHVLDQVDRIGALKQPSSS